MAIKYKWLAGQLREIIANDIKRGIRKLPSEMELCRKYHVSRQTVRQALTVIEEEGLIEKRQGSGSYITGLSSDPSRNTIAVIISEETEYIYPSLLNDIETELSSHGFHSNIQITHNKVMNERIILSELLASPPRGLIVEGVKSALPNPNLDLYHALRGKGCQIVFLHNYYPALSDCVYVKDDNYSGSVMLTEYLIRHGHTDICGIFKSDDMQGVERYQGFTETLCSYKLMPKDDHIYWFDSDDIDRLLYAKDTGYIKKIVQESIGSCTAILCYNELIAYFLIDELKCCAYGLPQDLLIVAFDNTYLNTSNIITLTHDPHEMGRTAAGMLISKLQGLSVHSCSLPWQLLPKGSSPAHFWNA